MRERPVYSWQSVFFTNEVMKTDNFSNTKQKFICRARFPKSALPPVRRGAHPPKKLCWFDLRCRQLLRWRIIEGILNSSTFVSRINECLRKEPTRNYIGKWSLCKIMHPVMFRKKYSYFFWFLVLILSFFPRPWLNLIIKYWSLSNCLLTVHTSIHLKPSGSSNSENSQLFRNTRFKWPHYARGWVWNRMRVCEHPDWLYG